MGLLRQYHLWLCIRLTVPTLLDYIGVHSYEGTDTTNTVNFRSDMTIDPVGKHVLVDDIIDTGGLLWCKEHLMQRTPHQYKLHMLVEKRRNMQLKRLAMCSNKFVGCDLSQSTFHQYHSLSFIIR